MANPVKGEAQLGGRTLAYNFGAFCALEEKSGKKVPELLQAMTMGLGFGEMRDFVWAGLQKHHPEATDADALALLDEHGYEQTASVIAKAVAGFFGSVKAKAKNPQKAAA